MGCRTLTKDFFHKLYPDKPPNYYVLLWRLQDKRSHWFKDIDQAAEFATDKENIYIGVGLSPQDNGPSKRCPANKIIGFPGHFIDIDIAGPAHRKGNLPESLEEALAIVDKFPLKPSIILNSGHGIQAWWLFTEPWLFDSKAEREQAQDECRRFNYTFKKLSGDREIDSVFDLSRVLRIPGTINAKREPHVPVEIIEINDIRYSLFDFDQHMVKTDELPAKPARVGTGIGITDGVVNVGDLVLDPAADPPAELFDVLCEVDPLFKATWECKRDPKKFPSLSEGDLALASLAAHAGWNDQQIANLLIAFRRRHKDRTNNPDKALRIDYLKSTLTRAHEGTKEIAREASFEILSNYFGVKVLSVKKYKQDVSTYVIETDAGEVKVPSTEELVRPSRLQNYFTEYIDVYFSQDKKRWPQVMNAILAIKEDVWVADEAMFSHRLKRRLVGFINYRPESRAKESDAVSKNNAEYDNRFDVLFGNDGCWLISIDAFWQYYDSNFNTHSSIDSKRSIFTQLRQWGCTAGHKINLWKNSKYGNRSERINRSYWKIPQQSCGVDPKTGGAVDPQTGAVEMADE